MKIYGLKNCDKCRAAAKALGALEIIDLRTAPPSHDFILKVLERFGEEALNKRSTTWRALAANDRIRPAFDLLREYPTLFKRPIIVTETGEIYCGWAKEVQQAVLP